MNETQPDALVSYPPEFFFIFALPLVFVLIWFVLQFTSSKPSNSFQSAQEKPDSDHG